MIGTMQGIGGLDNAQALIAITPSDAGVLNYRALYVGVGGVLHILDGQGNDVTLNVGQGFFTASVTRVFAASTTASQIFGVS
jgi:hypothetical protein